MSLSAVFTVYHSNDLDLLKSLLLNIISSQPLDNPFEKELILVQSPGMAQWLRMEMAQEQGILANIEFPLPATFIWQMFKQVLQDVPKRSFFNKEAMTWKLMKILPQKLDDPDFSELKNYLAHDGGKLKLFQLAGKIADIYDQYLVYRPDWIKAWESEKTVDELNDEPKWQAKLWRALFDYTLQLGQSPFHRANLYDVFIDTLESHIHKPIGLTGIKRIFIFGISALPPRYLQALNALGKHIDIHYMFENPCRYYWGDIRDKRYLAKYQQTQQGRISRDSTLNNIQQGDNALLYDPQETVGNSLLASMGKLGRDNLLLISELACNEIDQGFVDIERKTLLQHVQADILNLIEPGDIKETDTSRSKIAISLEDESIRIEACHSPMREVEVLHDKLLDMFNTDPSLTPRDIVVMVADINAYSPAIQAIFGNAPGARYIPYAISDRTAVQESPILSTFLRFLSLSDHRCSATELLEILEVPAVLRRFGLEPRQFDKIKFWVKEAGIRWGLDSSSSQSFGLPQQYQNTWIFGLYRMLLGYAMPSDTGLFQDILPYDEVQGLEADVAGKLCQFFHLVTQAQKSMVLDKVGVEWVKILITLFDDIFVLEDEEEKIGRLIRDQLEQWQQQLREACFDEMLSINVVRDHLEQKLSGESVSQRFLAGQVNFCTLMPMRSIPFSVICLLGMNDGQYPRAVAPLGFDLMAARALPGDRSRRDDDRYLFLEALQSAQKKLYISYLGRSVQDNTLKVPSVLVSELLDYCTQGYCLASDHDASFDQSKANLIRHLSHENTLVPFSPLAFSGATPSYAAEWLPAANREGKKAAEFITEQGLAQDPNIQTDILELKELQLFWRLPVKYFFNRRLKVYFQQTEDVIDENEPFDVNSLLRYQLQDALLSHLISHGNSPASIETYIKEQKGSGVLPHCHFGDIMLNTHMKPTMEQFEVISSFMGEEKPTLEINIKVNTQYGDVKLQGWLKQRYTNGRVLYRSGGIRPQDRLSVWLEHLCQCAAGESLPTHFVGREKSISLQPIDANEALSLLSFYINTYFTGLNTPLAFFPKSAFEGYLASLSKERVALPMTDEVFENVQEKMHLAFNGGFNVMGEKDDPYISRIWNEIDEKTSQTLYAYAKQCYAEMLNYTREK